MNRSDSYQVLCGGEWEGAAPLPPFADPVLAFLSDLSSALMKERRAKPYPDVMTFAFFCRRAHLEQMKAAYAGRIEDRIGRGLAFHIAPSNVPINFAYSLVAALLAGNASIVKASSRNFPQVALVCEGMSAVLAHHPALRPYVNVIAYARERQDVTEALSAICDARIIWGGDETVRRVRMAPLPPRAVEAAFADRYSLLVIRAESVLAMDDGQLARTAQDFYNDTYLTDQNACTAPRLVCWLGEGVPEAQERFWNAVHAYVEPRYPIEPVVAVDKLTAAYRAAIRLGAKQNAMPDNAVVRMQVDALTPEIEAHRCAGGFFMEYALRSLNELATIVQPKVQTLSYIGLDAQEARRFVMENGLRGIDRIVPVGHTMDFDLTWDGYDLIFTLSRRISTL